MTGIQIETNSRDAILLSWSRCAHQYKLKRNAIRPIPRLQSSEVAPRLEAMVERTGGRHGIFRRLADIAADVGHCLVITDRDGILVRLESKEAGSDWNGIALGSVWDERIAGTNGVSMALAEGRDFTVRGTEHYYSKLQVYACTAVPLRDASNEIIGAASLPSIDRGNPADTLFAKQLLGAAASRVQHSLFERAFRDRMIVSVAVPGRRELVKGAELIALDEHGNIVGATSGAHAIAGVPTHAELTGKPLDAVFGTDMESLDRVPGRGMSVRRDRGPLLDLWARTPMDRAKPFPGWQPNSRRPAIRRRLPPSLKDLATGSVVMAALCERALNSLAHGFPLLIEGNTGTGKSALVASLIGEVSQSVLIDCAALEDTEDDRAYIRTLIQQTRIASDINLDALHGTALVFDNLDEMPVYAQTALRSALDRLETKDVMSGPLPQIIATSRNPLEQSVLAGKFRDDLYYLLAGAAIKLPPLRAREKPDAIADVLARSIAGHDVEISPEARDAIASHDWPGNVRELRSALQQALMNGDGARITILDLALAAKHVANTPRKLAKHPAFDEKQMIHDALKGARWNVSKAARNLGMGRATINRKMKTFGISRPT